MKNKTQRGEVYLSEGDSLAKNHLFQKALLRLKKAHQMGCESAACKIGKIYMSSDFKDYEQAFSWLRLGAESGDREAQYYLSKFYESSNPQLSSSASFLRLNVLSSLN